MQGTNWAIGELSTPATASCPIRAQVAVLFTDLHAPLLRYMLGMGLPVHDGEDIVQEAFLSLFHHLKKGKPEDNLRGWVFRVAHNLALKRRQRNSRTLDIDILAAVVCQDPAPNPEQQALLKNRYARLQAILQALPERDRWCLLLRAEGLRYREIAVTLDMSLGGVAASVSRSLSRMGGLR